MKTADKLVIFLLFFSLPLSAASPWHVGGKISVIQQDNTPRLKLSGFAEFRPIQYFSWRTDAELVFVDLQGKGDFDLSIPSNALWYPVGNKFVLEPFIGPGVTYTYSHAGRSLFGCNALAGVNYHLNPSTVLGIEFRFTVPDVTKWSRYTYDLGFTGNWELNFNKGQ